jgi:hypothetical protein
VCESGSECLIAFPRGISERRALEAEWIAQAGDPPGEYAETRYRVGTALASALWRATDDHDAMTAALVGALADLGDRVRAEPPWAAAPPSFGPAWLLDPILERLDAPTAAALCAIVVTDLAPIAEHVTRCAE